MARTLPHIREMNVLAVTDGSFATVRNKRSTQRDNRAEWSTGMIHDVTAVTSATETVYQRRQEQTAPTTQCCPAASGRQHVPLHYATKHTKMAFSSAYECMYVCICVYPQ